MKTSKETRKLFKVLENHGCRIENTKKGVNIFQPSTHLSRNLSKAPFYSMHISDRSGMKPFLDFVLNHWDSYVVAAFAREVSKLGYPTFAAKVAKRSGQ